MKKKFFTKAIVAFGVFSLSFLVGCGLNEHHSDDKNEKSVAEENNGDKNTAENTSGDEAVLKIGLDDTFEPMGYRDENQKLVGFDIDLAEAVGKELNMKVEFVPIEWDSKDLALKSHKIDCVWNGMSATPERAKAMSLSKKYINNSISLMAINKDVKIDKDEDLKKYKIGTQADSSALEVLKSNKDYDSFKNNIREYPTYNEAILDLKAGRVDVIAVDEVLGNFKNKSMDNILSTCNLNLGDDFYVIGFRLDDTALRDKVNGAIEKLIENGEAEKISNKWFGKNIVVFED